MRILRQLCIVLFVVAVSPAAQPPSTPGLHESLPCVEDPTFTVDLFLPAQYDQDAERSFPVFFLSSPGGNPNLKSYRAWADERGWILVALNNSENGPWEPIVKNQDLAWKSLEVWGIRAHQCLRYAGGMSGAAWASVKFARRYPQQFAGVHLSGHSGNGDYVPAHVAVGFYAGRKDETHSLSHVRGAIRSYEQRGNPVLVEIHDGGHDAAPPATICKQLDWMYLRTVLQHPQLTDEDRAAGEVWLASERERVLGLDDVLARSERLTELLSVDGIHESGLGEELIVDWGVSLSEQVAVTADEALRFWMIFDASRQPWFNELERDQRRKLGKELKSLKRSKAVKLELAAWAAMRKVEALEEKANTDKKHAEVADAYGQIAEAFPDTRYGRLAAERR